jgi:ATP-binding cassette, subfamily B, bacterial
MGMLRVYLLVLRRMRPYVGRLAFAILEVLLMSALEVLKPWPIKLVIDNVLRGQPMRSAWIPPMSPGTLLAVSCLGLVALYAASAGLQVTNNYLTISIGQRMVNDLRGRLFEHLQRLSLSFHRRREIGDLLVRITYDTFSIQTIAMNGLFPIVSSGALLVGMFAVMVRIDAMLTAIALAIVPLLLLLIIGLSGRIDRLASSARAKESRLQSVAHRALSSIHVVQAFSAEGESHRQFVESSDQSLGAALKLYTLQTAYTGAVGVMIACGTAAAIYVGALHVLGGTLTIGGLVVFASYLASLYAPINQLFQTYGLVQSAKAGMVRCLELLAIEPDIKDRPGAVALERARGELEFAEVWFGYDPSRPVLKGVSFKASPGETIAIVGLSGAGKSTMASLVPRFYEAQRGAVRVDGRDIRDLTLKSLRENIAMVLQPPLVLNDTVRANIALGRPGASGAQIQHAAEVARLAPVLAKLPAGLDEIVGQGGHTLSEGEAQRITIARALLKDAPILIMDEPTSALDAETESLVLAAIAEVMRGRTTLVIAHRLSTVQNADRILVLREGAIAEAGSFGELLSRGGFFSYLYSLQSWSREAGAGRA